MPPGTVGTGTETLAQEAQLVDGPLRAQVPRRPQHRRRWRVSASGAPRVGLVAVTLSAATVAALAVGTVHGLRSDQESARAADQMVTLQQAATSLPDARFEAVADNRANVAAAAQAARNRAQASAAKAATQAAAARAAQQASQQASQQAAQAAAAAKSRQQAAAGQVSRSTTRSASASGGSAQSIAQAMLAARGWSGQWTCLNSLWQRESGWNYQARNASSGAFGIPQALPGSKMASAGSDWATNPATQIRWGLSYIASTYGTPCGAWAHSQSHGWY